jgi:peptide-methionine (S)-S-oxide reductase
MPEVVRTCVGYAGGSKREPTYHDLGDHAESIRVEFDAELIRFEGMVERVWESHNPCGVPWSRQYMNAIFWEGDFQKEVVLRSKAALEARLGRAVKTALLPLGTFWPAEGYHQKYYLRSDDEVLEAFARRYGGDPFIRSTAAARVNALMAGEGDAGLLARIESDPGLPPEVLDRLRSFVA